jgi:hypothetical protein
MCWSVRQLAALHGHDKTGHGWVVKRPGTEGQGASELRDTAGRDRGRDREERGTYHMETWNKDDLDCTLIVS